MADMRFVADGTAGVTIIDIGASQFSSLFAGMLGASIADIEQNLTVGRNAQIGSNLNVSHNTLIGGALAITGSASSSLLTNNTNPALLVNSGYVGIGTTSPSSKLTVYGNVLVEGSNNYLNFGSTAGSGGYGFFDNAGILQVKNSGGSWNNILSSSSDSIAPNVLSTSGKTDEYCLTYEETGETLVWQTCGGGASALNDLTDVDTTNVATGDLIYYNGASWATTSTSTLGLPTGGYSYHCCCQRLTARI